MESKRRRLVAPVQQRNWLPFKCTYRKPLPLSGEGVVSVNTQRRTTFAIRIRPARKPAICDNKMQTEEADEGADENGYVEVEISTSGAIFKAKKPCSKIEQLNRTSEPSQGLEEGKKVSYWFSFNRDDRVLKYGKGYIMEQTTLLTHEFPFPEEDSDPWKFIFRPDKAKQVVIIDVTGIEALAMLEHPDQREKFLSLSQGDMDHQATQAYRSIYQDEQIRELRSLVDVEKRVSFYPHPLTHNWSPLVLDSSKATLDILSTNLFTMSASLPATCRELYENVSSPGVTLDWPYKNPRFSDVINYSIKTEGKILKEKLEEKEKNGKFQYLRVNVGTDRGSSPGIPYVLEIWPPGSESPIHSHGNAYAVEKVLYGAIKFTIYNKTWDKEKPQKELMSFTATQGDVSWMSPNWFQTHKLTNESNELFCATLQCYKYGQDDELMWPYFDYLEDKTVEEFLPVSDFECSFKELRKRLFQEYRDGHPDS